MLKIIDSTYYLLIKKIKSKIIFKQPYTIFKHKYPSIHASNLRANVTL